MVVNVDVAFIELRRAGSLEIRKMLMVIKASLAAAMNVATTIKGY